MVDDDQQHDIEITSNTKNIKNTTTKTNTNIEEHDLELSLSLRPTNNVNSHMINNILTKRDAQAIRRHEAKLKRDLKRKPQASVHNNDNVVFVANNGNKKQRYGKVPNLGFQVGPPWLGWNAGCFNGGGLQSVQGQNCKFTSEEGNGCVNGNGNDCGSFSSGSSSGISDNHHSVSGAGANSSDAGSHSSHPNPQLPPPNVPSTNSQLPPCSSQLDLQPNDSDPNHSKPQLCSSNSNKTELAPSSTPSNKSPEGVSTSSNTTNQQNGASPTSDKDPNTTPRSIISKEGKGETGKPPRPNGLKSQQKVLSSEMPCVSATGNGPNGKTVTGFLYKYTKTEVSIICVCHGSSFSPAEFVEHAGGVDVEYPLKHIRVVPFALG